MLSNTAEYALRAVLLLANQKNGKRVSAKEIAQATGAPANYMAKILNDPAHKGVVSSVCGKRGGFTLDVSPEKLSLAELAGHFDPPSTSPHCLMADRPCDPTKPCQAHMAWTEVSRAARAPLEAVSIADLLSRSAKSIC